MKKLLFSLLLILGTLAPGFSQGLVGQRYTCALNITTTTCAIPDAAGQGIKFHRIVWTVNGQNTGSTGLLQYRDLSSGSYMTLITGTTTSNSFSSVTAGVHAHWQLTLSGFAASAPNSVTITWLGYYDDPSIAGGGTVAFDQSTPGTTNGVYVTNLTADSADNAAFTENPVGIGGAYVAAPADHTTGDKATLLTDIKGSLSVAPIPTGSVSFKCTISSAMTETTSTVCGALVASSYIYIQSCQFGNSHASVGTLELMQDGSGGTTIAEPPNPSAGTAGLLGGNTVEFKPFLKVTTIGTALYIANVTTGSSTTVSCQGFSSPVSY